MRQQSYLFHTPCIRPPPVRGVDPRWNLRTFVEECIVLHYYTYCHTPLLWKNQNGGANRCLKNVEDMYNRLDRISACDGRTDGQTSSHGIVCAMNMRRAVIIGQHFSKL